jgi:preprotein translocase subunit SecE
LNGKPETRAPVLDYIKLTAAVLILLAAVGGFYVYGDKPLLVRVLGILAAAAVALVLALRTDAGRGGSSFVLEARDEVRRVVWPTRKETVQTTMVIIGIVLLVAIFLWLVDMVLVKAVQGLTGPRA